MKRFLLSVLLLALSPLFCSAQQTVVALPDSTYTHPPASCTICAGAMWTDENKVQLFDNQYAETELMPFLFCFQSMCYRSRYMAANRFEFSIPANASITGIEVRLSGFASHSLAVYDSTIRLTKNYAMVGANTPDSAAWDLQDENRVYGVGLGLWGETWTPAEINDPGFGVFFKVFNRSDSMPLFKLDVVSVSVHYTTPQGTSVQTSTPKTFISVFYSSVSQLAVTFEPALPGEDYTFELLNISGTVLHREPLPDLSFFDARVHTLGFSPGVYFVRFLSGEKQFVRRLVLAP
ncbi:MAG: T9SS type A sorting domain-containing protein [Bacteroidia bacterium]|nr:T9SS type A sorting domain-containing protein [Bacteroidia bacterium]